MLNQQQPGQQPLQPHPSDFDAFTLLKVPQYIHDLWQPLVTDEQQLQMGEVEIHVLPNGQREAYLIIPVGKNTPGLDPNATEMRIPLTTIKKPENPQYALFLAETGQQHQHLDNIRSIKEAKIPFSIHHELIQHQQAIVEQQKEARKLMHEDMGEDQTAYESLYVGEEYLANKKQPAQRLVSKSDDEILDIFHTLYKSNPAYTKSELETLAKQPKAAIDRVVAKYCTKITSGPNKNKYELTSMTNQREYGW